MSYGAPEVMHLVEVDELRLPDDGELIEMPAAGVNPLDWKIRSGRKSSDLPAYSVRLGSGAAGVVRATGKAAESFSAGDAVIAYGLSATYAITLLVTSS